MGNSLVLRIQMYICYHLRSGHHLINMKMFAIPKFYMYNRKYLRRWLKVIKFLHFESFHGTNSFIAVCVEKNRKIPPFTHQMFMCYAQFFNGISEIREVLNKLVKRNVCSHINVGCTLLSHRIFMIR